MHLTTPESPVRTTLLQPPLALAALLEATEVPSL